MVGGWHKAEKEGVVGNVHRGYPGFQPAGPAGSLRRRRLEPADGAGIISSRTCAVGKAMVITLGPELEAVLSEHARRQGLAAEAVVLNALRERFLGAALPQPRDEWERRLLGLAKDCGVSLSDESISRTALYD